MQHSGASDEEGSSADRGDKRKKSIQSSVGSRRAGGAGSACSSARRSASELEPGLTAEGYRTDAEQDVEHL